MAATTATLDASLAANGILMDASGVVIGALDAHDLGVLIRLCKAAGHALTYNSSEHLIVTPNPADTGTA